MKSITCIIRSSFFITLLVASCQQPDGEPAVSPQSVPVPAPAKTVATEPEPLATLRALARPVADDACLDPLIERLGRARLALLGEASHGTAEFYTRRAEISRRLIEEHGFQFIAVEGDWATCHQLNRYVKQLPAAGASARDIMSGFNRWPVWMWANEETRALIEWLRAYNRDRPMDERVGFYGMDVYGKDEARDKVVQGLAALDPNLAETVRTAYLPFETFRGEPNRYARALAAGDRSLEDNARTVWRLIQAHADTLRAPCRYAFFHIEQSALAVKAAERHFRAMTQRGPDSWNERADHFYAAVERILEFYGEDARGIVWAHNTHVGDARATPMAQQGRRNIGQIARQRQGRERVAILGFGTHRGTVKAGRQWGGPRERMAVPPAHADSYEDWMNRLEMATALFLFDPATRAAALRAPRGHRAIGVVYRPEPESPGQYVPTLLPERYDAFLFIAQTRALTPLATALPTRH